MRVEKFFSNMPSYRISRKNTRETVHFCQYTGNALPSAPHPFPKLILHYPPPELDYASPADIKYIPKGTSYDAQRETFQFLY